MARKGTKKRGRKKKRSVATSTLIRYLKKPDALPKIRKLVRKASGYKGILAG